MAFGAGSYPEPPDEKEPRMNECENCADGRVLWCRDHNCETWEGEKDGCCTWTDLGEHDLGTKFELRVCPICKGMNEVEIDDDGEVVS